MAEYCTRCGLCVKECRFLATYGPPGAVAENLLSGGETPALAFECSLCGLCAEVCPVGLDPAAVFLDLRRAWVREGSDNFPEHKAILAYERRGMSRRYTWTGLPEGCETVFFPGCGLSGSRPGRVFQVYEALRKAEPTLGVMLDCCGKPSHDLGRSDYFNLAFSGITSVLRDHGVRRVLVACPNCHAVFREYGEGLAVESIYERMAEMPEPVAGRTTGTVTVHDPCAVRFESAMHDAARSLIRSSGLTVREMPHARERTLCCGLGASVPFLSQEYATTWRSKRKSEVNGERLITYCSGCAGFLSTAAPTSHLLDLVFDPAVTMAGKASVARAPVTYWNRLRLKARFRKHVPAVYTRERQYPERVSRPLRTALKAGVAGLLLAAIVFLHWSGVAGHLDQGSLRNWIASAGVLAPILYILAYTAAPVLLLPALPFAIAAGVLFGPFWGVIYAITGATLGACVAFFVARYMAGDWVRGRLRSPRWKKLDGTVERNGWKVVVLTRLVPLFPYNLLNYAFGLTRIRFIPYALATFLGMLPACIAFVAFSASLLDLFRGNVSGGFVAG
jgi:uncharacterized membrane protein YdjX (TVP38/TMEM64 family)/Fe-S oxidoreductase